MPTMASITVKKADGTTDIVFDSIAASGGESSPAVWRQDTGAVAGLPVGLRPLVKAMTKSNGPKTARIFAAEGVFPYSYQDTTTSVYSSKDRVIWNLSVTLPQGIPSSALNEATAQLCNLIASTLFKQMMAAGYAAT